jgi:hypothetical protein
MERRTSLNPQLQFPPRFHGAADTSEGEDAGDCEHKLEQEEVSDYPLQLWVADSEETAVEKEDAHFYDRHANGVDDWQRVGKF